MTEKNDTESKTVFSETTQEIEVSVTPVYNAEQSTQDKYAFEYHITIKNTGKRGVQLIDRHWVITDMDNRVMHVKGEGVVGKQPVIAPGKQYKYSSYTGISGPAGVMEGEYGMIYCDDGEPFEVRIPRFELIAKQLFN